MAAYGAMRKGAIHAGPRDKVVWVGERPTAWQGAWALGCSLCAGALARRAALGLDVGDGVGAMPLANPCDTAGTARARGGPRWRLATNWARYDARPMALQAEHLKQHACSDVHKLAEKMFLQPAAPIVLSLQAQEADDRLLSGAVPQPADWVRAWRAIREGVSWATAEKLCESEHWIAAVRNRPVLRRGIQNMALVIREVLRIQKRAWVQEATCISLSFDDRQAHKLIVFNCDMPLHSRGDALPLRQRGAPHSPFRTGILGCLDMVHGESSESMDDDYAERTCTKVMSMIEAFATPMGEAQADAAVVGKFRSCTKSIIVDGALQKVATLLRLRFFGAVVLICRDPAHMIRIACSEPLCRTGRFEEQHRRLFTSRHALLKDFQFSVNLQARLESCQREVLAAQGSQGGVSHTLRHFSYAAHRWESFAAPRRQYACLLQAIFTCLAQVANDTRSPAEKRSRALACLEAMTAQDILEAGIAGDYSEVCLRSRQ